MDKLKQIGFAIALCMINVFCFAQQQQNATGEDQADLMRSNGKIYVVVAIVVTIVIGIFIYLLSLERKIKKLEKNNKK